jgi:hypothetical protein
MAVLRSLYPDIHTRRGLHQKRYMVRAMAIVKDDPDCRWLVDHSIPLMRQAILSELGRVDRPDEILALARAVCKLRPTSKEGAAMVRRARRGSVAVADTLLLANQVIDVLNAHAVSHDGCTRDVMVAALETALGMVKEPAS